MAVADAGWRVGRLPKPRESVPEVIAQSESETTLGQGSGNCPLTGRRRGVGSVRADTITTRLDPHGCPRGRTSHGWTFGAPVSPRKATHGYRAPCRRTGCVVCGTWAVLGRRDQHRRASYAPFWIGSYGLIDKTWRTTNDSYAIYLNAKWDSAHRAGITQYHGNTWRYTQDFRSGNAAFPVSLSANLRYATTFENPVYDRDDNSNNGVLKFDEAEITAVSLSFPSVDSNYYADVQFSHWYRACDGCNFLWDSDGDEIGYRSQMSDFGNLTGEWDSQLSSSLYRFTSTPFKPQPAGAASSSSDEGSNWPEPDDPGVNLLRREFEASGVRASVVQDGIEVDLRIQPPLVLEDYIAANEARMAALPANERFRVVITFVQPISTRTARTVLGDRATCESLEAIGRLPGGQILTQGAGELFDLKAAFADYEATALGIVAAECMVHSSSHLHDLAQDPNVLLADVAKETLSRSMPAWVLDLRRGGGLDVILNDVYWAHAELD